MPFCKRITAPKDVCKSALRSAGAPFTDLADVCGFSLCSIIRQLSDLCRQSVSILEELEGEIASICHRSGTLENKVISLQRHVSALAASKPPLKTTTNLDSESKRTAHFQSSWQQHVNVFGSWSRPECVQELHQEAQLNLQSLLQDFEEQLYDNRVTGQTFRHPSSQSSEDTSTTFSRSPSSHNNKKTEFVFLPANKQVCEDETTSLGIRAQDPAACGSDRSLLGWNSSVGPPVAEKPRWHLSRHSSAHLVPIDVTGQSFDKHASELQAPFRTEKAVNPKTIRRPRSVIAGPDVTLHCQGDGKILAVDLIQGACSPDSSQPRSLEPTTENTGEQHIPLRKTQSDREHSVPPSPKAPKGMMDHATLMCPSSSWNGPKGSTFSPSWNDSYSYALTPDPAAKQPLSKPGKSDSGGGGLICPSQTSSTMSISSVSHSNSFTFISEPSGHRTYAVTHGNAIKGKIYETEGAAPSPAAGNGLNKCEQEKKSTRANAFKFRERSLSTPTDSGSLCSTDNICCPGETVPIVREGESYALLYPSNSSEDNTSTDNVSVATGSDFFPVSRLRSRSRSISLKKPKKKPPPPVRSVSLVKNLSAIGGMGSHHDERHIRDGRPKSLFIPRDHNFQDSFQPEFLMASKPDEETHSSLETSQPPDREAELGFPPHWQLSEWKSNNDPYRSLSGSSTATGTTVIECVKVRESSESLNSPSTSRATSPSPVSIEAETKASPFKPPCLMSPSSGYSSQSETPTPTITYPAISGLTPTGCKMRPKIPERKSSLPATSPKDKSQSRLSFELPANSPVDLSSVKPKPKASRRHSDTSTTNKPGKPSQSSLPMVTTTDLRNIRLRSVSRSELEDSPDGSSDIIEEEQGRDISPPTTLYSSKPPKPPVAVKPPLPKRPMNLMLKSPSSSPHAQESPPASPIDRPMPVGNIYMVVRKPKPKRPSQSSTSPSAVTPQEHVPRNPPPLPELDLEHGIPIEEDFIFPSSPEKEDIGKNLCGQSPIFCIGELDKKKPKVPPPVPKKPNVLLLPSPTVQVPSNGTTEKQSLLLESGSQSPLGPPPSEAEEASYNEDDQDISIYQEIPGGWQSNAHHEHQGHLEGLGNEENNDAPEDGTPKDIGSIRDVEIKAFTAEIMAEAPLEENSSIKDKTELHITEETDDDVLVNTPTTHTTEDLFTIIHRSKRKVLGRKEQAFGSRQSLVSPVKSSSSDIRTLTLGSTPRSNSRNENFMALLQKKGSKSSSGTRVSAMELLKSTNPLARRVTEFSQSDLDAAGTDPSKTALPDQ
ncbi:NHS-like protein 2 isoform X1 [Silurus meridionalis]|uniref:NHS-like protein 2 isoform X1 n=1 Tax=Silurus meridionalis TaxID=175797 RepID=UPI001EEB5E24|nr:NHS-like protein 2 isoform X1 [Silurus meridionalis]